MNILSGRMNSCELCGAQAEDGQKTCPRCGFEFPEVVRSDIRDEKILERYKEKPLETVKRDLRDKLSQMISYFENVDLGQMDVNDLTAFVDEALAFLHVPVTLGLGDEMNFNEREEILILVTVSKLEEADNISGRPLASTRSYIRLANALNCLGECSRAMEMIDKALLKEPNNIDALFGKAILNFNEKKYEEAKRYLEKLMAKTEAHSKALYLAEMIDQLSS